jgi:ribosomal protein S13
LEATEMERKPKLIELTDEDLMNVSKWITATSIMVEAKVRTPFSESEIKTAEKLRRW